MCIDTSSHNGDVVYIIDDEFDKVYKWDANSFRPYLCINLSLSPATFSFTKGLEIEYTREYLAVIAKKFGIGLLDMPYQLLVLDKNMLAVASEELPKKELEELLRAKVNAPYLFK